MFSEEKQRDQLRGCGKRPGSAEGVRCYFDHVSLLSSNQEQWLEGTDVPGPLSKITTVSARERQKRSLIPKAVGGGG